MSQLKSICICLPPVGGRPDLWSLPQCFFYLGQLLTALFAGFEGFVEVDGAETGPVVGLCLGELVAVGADNGPDGCVPAACHGVVHENYGFDAARDLDGAYGVAEVHDVRLVRPRPGRLLPLDEPEFPALVAVTDPVRVRRHGPRVVQELLHALFGQPVAREADDHAQLRLAGVGRNVVAIHALPDAIRAVSGVPGLQLVAFLQGAAFVTPEPDQGVRRAAVHEKGNVYPARHGQVSPRPAPQVVEGEHVARRNRERLPGRRFPPVYLRGHLGAGYGDDGVFGERQLGPEVGELQPGLVLFVADQVVTDLVRERVHRPRRRHAERVLPETPRVLNGTQEARLTNLNRHRAPPGSPGCRRAGPPANGPGGIRTLSCDTRTSRSRPRTVSGRTPPGPRPCS